MTPTVPRARRPLLAAFAGLLVAAHLAHLRTGLADQGDYARSTDLLLAGPVALPPELAPREGTVRDPRVRAAWDDAWTLRDRPAWDRLYNASSYKLVLAAQIGLERLVTGDGVYRLSTGSLPVRAVLVAGVVALAALALAEAPLGAALLLLLLAGAAAVETGFVAFLNSAYEDQVAIATLPALAALVWRCARAPSPRRAAAALALAAFAGASKAQLFALPLLAAPFAWPALRAGMTRRRAAAAVAAAGLAAALPLALNPAGGVNAYHATYHGLLRVLEPGDLAAARLGGRPVLGECVGVKAFGGAGPDCLRRAAVRPADVVALAARHPDAALEVLRRIVVRGAGVELAYLGKAPRDAPASSRAGFPAFGAWRAAFAALGPALTGLAALATLLLLLAARRGPLAGAARAGAFLGAVGATQVLVAAGDGLVEVEKHLVVGNYANALALGTAALVLAWAVALRREPAGAPVAPSA